MGEFREAEGKNKVELGKDTTSARPISAGRGAGKDVIKKKSC